MVKIVSAAVMSSTQPGWNVLNCCYPLLVARDHENFSDLGCDCASYNNLPLEAPANTSQREVRTHTRACPKGVRSFPGAAERHGQERDATPLARLRLAM